MSSKLCWRISPLAVESWVASVRPAPRAGAGRCPPPSERGPFRPVHTPMCRSWVPRLYVHWKPILDVTGTHSECQTLCDGAPHPCFAVTEPLPQALQLEQRLPRCWLVCRPSPCCHLAALLLLPPPTIGPFSSSRSPGVPRGSMSLKQQAGGPGGRGCEPPALLP